MILGAIVGAATLALGQGAGFVAGLAGPAALIALGRGSVAVSRDQAGRGHLMPTTARTPSREHDRDRDQNWIILASMFVGQRLDRGAAIGAYVAATATLAVSVIILLVASR